MNIITFTFFLLLLSQLLPAQAPPTAGFSVDSITPAWGAPGAIDLFIASSSIGATSTTYLIHDAGVVGPTWGSMNNNQPNPIFTFYHPAPSVCYVFYVTQIVSNANGSDSLTQAYDMGCPCLSPPLYYGVIATPGPYGYVSLTATTNDNSPLAYIQGPNVNYCPQSFGCDGTMPTPGTYSFCAQFDGGTCSPTSQSGCTTITLDCTGPPIADYTVSNATDSIFFTNTSLSWPLHEVVWDFGDGDTSHQENPVHVYDSTGQYLVCLTVSDSCGSDTFCTMVFAQTVHTEVGQGMNMEVYPNPSGESLRVKGLPLGLVNGKLELYNPVGKLLISQSIQDGEAVQQVDLSGLDAGIYLLRLREGNESVGRPLKVVKE